MTRNKDIESHQRTAAVDASANGSASVQQLYQKRSHHLLLRVRGRDSLHDCAFFHTFFRQPSKPDKVLLASATCGLVYGEGARAEVRRGAGPAVEHEFPWSTHAGGTHCTINGNYCAMIVVVVAGGAAS